MVISRQRVCIYAAYCLVLWLIGLPLLLQIDGPRIPSLTLALLSGCLIPITLVFGRRLNLVEPVHVFALMYYWFFLGALYFILTDFSLAQHLLIASPAVRYRTLELALWLVNAGWIAFLVGYLMCRRRDVAEGRWQIAFTSRQQLPGWLVRLAILACVAVGLLNFLYVVNLYPGGVFEYYSDIGLRTRRLDMMQASVSTLGFNLIYAAPVLGAFVVLRDRSLGRHSGEWRLVVITALFALAVFLGQARIFAAISYAMLLAGLIYVNSTAARKNTYFGVGVFVLFVSGLVFFVVRIVSILTHNHPGFTASVSLTELLRTAIQSLLYFVVGKGNVPNLPAVMNLLAYGHGDGELLFGRTFFSWLGALTGSEGGNSIASQLGAAWGTTVGGVPPTVIGELFLNFHIVGVPVGMFFLGMACAAVYEFTKACRSFWVWFVYLAILFRFIFVLPKGEMYNLEGALMLALPTVLIVVVLRLAVFAIGGRYDDDVHQVTETARPGGIIAAKGTGDV